MYAVIETGGKQYRVSEGDAISVEKLPYEVGDEVEFERVLLVSGKEGMTIGQPIVKGAKVVAKVDGVAINAVEGVLACDARGVEARAIQHAPGESAAPIGRRDQGGLAGVR